MAAAAAASSSSPSPQPPKILVIGFGALGALYSWLLTRGGAQIYALARSNAKSLSEGGIDIESQRYGDEKGFKPFKVLASAEEVRQHGPYDYVLCTMKIVPEEQSTGEFLLNILRGKQKGSNTYSNVPKSQRPTIVFVENGIGIEEEPYQTLCNGEEDDAVAGTIISCCAWLGATLERGGTLVSHGTMETLQMGLYPAPDSHNADPAEIAWRRQNLKVFSDTYARGGGGAEPFEGDIQPQRWRKLLWNAAWGGLTTLARQTVYTMLLDENLPYTAEVCRKIMLEVLYTARACGINEDALPSSTVDEIFDLTYSQAPSILAHGTTETNLKRSFKPSLLVDLEANRGMELSPIIENVVKRARLHQIDTPRLELILAALRPSLMNVVRKKKEEEEEASPPMTK
ncbi:hypothetical protein CBS101457_000619 [Exobasidium rhododendri]|nr:hypothetical protein CBS101457_000619 [Exobasidium rhododendri]